MVLSLTLGGRERFTRIWKYALRRVLFPICVLVPFAYVFPKIALFYAICGAYDVGRNRPLNAETLRRYFIGNGFGAWMVSPLNILLDLLSLPYINKGVYRLADLPPSYQDEVKRLVQAANDADLVGQLKELSKQHQRTMMFFRWYGVNLDTLLNVPAFHQPWKYIQTIEVDLQSESIDLEALRLAARVVAGALQSQRDEGRFRLHRRRRHHQPLARKPAVHFRRTLLHLSANETDQVRYCLFVDIVRPTPFPRVMTGVMTMVRTLTQNFKFIYYGNWKIVE